MKKFIAVFGVFAAFAFAVPAFAQYAPTYPYPTLPPAYACPQLTYNLYRGVRDYYTGGQVSQLQQFLAGRYGNQLVTGYFGSMTAANVAQFQREQGVWPVTGGVGPLTRAAIARVCGGYGGGGGYGTLSINGISGPTQLQAGQAGTWQITVNDQSGNLSYSVVWGDEQYYGYGLSVPMSASAAYSGSLSHTYSQSGTYTPRFTVTNAYGQSANASVTVTVGGMQNNSATFSAYPTSGQAPLGVSFWYMLGADSADGFSVNFGDGTSGSLSVGCGGNPLSGSNACPRALTAYHTYTASGTYTATLFKNTCPAGVQCFVGPQTVGSATITVYGTGQYSVTAYPTSGYTPLTVTFGVNNYSGQYAVDFGDGTSASQVSGSVSHTYYTHGTYTAQFQSDPACRHTSPQCMIATLYLGSVSITALMATL